MEVKTLNLMNQSTPSVAILSSITDLRALLNDRKAVWDRIPREKKINWARSGKDPIMNLFLEFLEYAHKNFPDLWEVIDRG